MPKLCVYNFTISLDGYAAGLNQSRENPLGGGGEQLHKWAFETHSFRKNLGMSGGQDVRLGGGAATIQQYLRAGLVDEMHLVITPILLGAGERLFDNLDGGPVGYECVELVSSPSVTHVRLAKTTT